MGDLAYPLIADLKHEIVKAYHVENEDGHAIRGTYIIDPQGVIQHATINNAPIGRNVDETIRTLQAVKYVQENPDEVRSQNLAPLPRIDPAHCYYALPLCPPTTSAVVRHALYC